MYDAVIGVASTEWYHFPVHIAQKDENQLPRRLTARVSEYARTTVGSGQCCYLYRLFGEALARLCLPAALRLAFALSWSLSSCLQTADGVTEAVLLEALQPLLSLLGFGAAAAVAPSARRHWTLAALFHPHHCCQYRSPLAASGGRGELAPARLDLRRRTLAAGVSGAG